MKTLTTIGIIAGTAALAVAAVILAKKNCSMSDNDDASDHIKGKLSSFKRKAEKEFREMKSSAEANPAAERVNKWVNSTL